MTVCKVHAPDYWDKASKVSHKLMYAMSTIENHSFENESEINYIVVKWFKAHNLVLIGNYFDLFILAQDDASNEERFPSALRDFTTGAS